MINDVNLNTSCHRNFAENYFRFDFAGTMLVSISVRGCLRAWTVREAVP